MMPASWTASMSAPVSRAGLGSETLPSAPRQVRHPWLRPVEIAAVGVNLPVTTSSPVANAQLDYLFVKLRDAQQVAQLQRVVPLTELNLHRGTLMARVGIFTRSQRGRLRMEQLIKALHDERHELLVARGGEPQPLSALG